jgi:ABC-type siderophore export system fused ATPase/permease subunit
MVVTHDNRIFSFADTIARMDDGRIVKIESGLRNGNNAAIGSPREPETKEML